MIRSSTLRHPDRRIVWVASVLLFFCFYMFWPINYYLAASLKQTYYMLGVPLLVGGVLYFRRLRDGAEYRLLVAYWLWFWLSRVLNGSPALDQDFQLTVDLALMLPFFALGLGLTAIERRRFLDWLSAVVGGFYFLVGLLCLFAFVQRRIYINPITEGSIGLYDGVGFLRLNVFDIHPNATAYWFLMSLFLMIYQFFACKAKLWRIPIVLTALVDYLVIAITYSRSVRLATAFALGLLTVLLLRRLRFSSRLVRALVLLAGCLAGLAIAYEASSWSAEGLSALSYRLYPSRFTQIAAEGPADAASDGLAAADRAFPAPLAARAGSPELTPASLSIDSGTGRSDPRQWDGSLENLSNGRFMIWRSALQALRVDPSVLWRGKLTDDVMTIANTFVDTNVTGGEPVHFHNSLIQILMTTGLPGLLFALAMLVLLLSHCARLLSPLCPATLAEQTLILPVAATIVHFLLEAGLFTACDVRTLFYFLISGIALGFARETQA